MSLTDLDQEEQLSVELKRRYVASVLRRLLRSFPGAHGCHNPNLELSISQVYPPKKNRQKMEQNHFCPEKSAIKDTRTVTVTCRRCGPPSWGNVIGNDQPGAPGSSSEWSRGAPEVFTYDQVFQQEEGYDMRLERDDRKHFKGRGLDIYEEEKSRAVPVRSSAEYGRRPVPPTYQTSRQHSRVACIKAEFFMKNGIIRNVAEGYGSVVPN
ncbi:hypothetical protein FQN60_007731 [Etheostoma spectabile]|uniref:Uncharacterized protein n=1 Tax=Etheostoma spectabile TaxID=54343 RepID=A0A5J5CUX0_9PERO|nr:hypothetical protein FQN60_007731 [Etheostoma spectabile]